MKLCICLLLTIATLTAADDAANKKAAPAKPAFKPPAPITVPPDAVELGPGLWTHTDAQGRKWRYRKTPFGMTRWEEKPAAAAEAGSAAPAGVRPTEDTKVVEDGDSVLFERPGLFGTYRWKRKKSELTAEEKAVWQREREKTAARKADNAAAPKKGKPE